MKKIILILIPILLTFCSCSKGYQSHSFFAMDTFITIDMQTKNSKLAEEIEDIVYRDEKSFSRTFSGCGLYEFNKSCDGNSLPEDTENLLLKAVDMHKKTDGAFSPYLGALTELWNIKGENPSVPDKSEIQNALSVSKSENLIIDGDSISKTPELLLDFGAIAKGESANNCVEHLKSNGVENAVISFGGSVACMGHSQKSHDSWNIGIKNPFDTSQIIGSINVTDCFVAVSGAYERSFTQNGKRYHHILCPESGYPAETDIESTAVIADDGAVADGLSTALFVMGSDKAMDFYSSGVYDFEAILILKNGNIIVTKGLSEVFSFNSNASFKNGRTLKYNK